LTLNGGFVIIALNSELLKEKPVRSIKEIFRIGNGPSSSHTMGPKKAAEIFSHKYPNAAEFHVTLFGSLAAPAKGT